MCNKTHPWERPVCSCDHPHVFDPVAKRWYRTDQGQIKLALPEDVEAMWKITPAERAVEEAISILAWRQFLAYTEYIEKNMLPGTVIVHHREMGVHMRHRASPPKAEKEEEDE